MVLLLSLVPMATASFRLFFSASLADFCRLCVVLPTSARILHSEQIAEQPGTGCCVPSPPILRVWEGSAGAAREKVGKRVMGSEVNVISEHG